MKISFEAGTVCNVLIRGQKNIRRRIYKWPETRFGSIPCHVFTSPCRKDVRAVYDPVSKSLTISGSRVPASEVPVPEYDILLCEPYRNPKPL